MGVSVLAITLASASAQPLAQELSQFRPEGAVGFILRPGLARPPLASSGSLSRQKPPVSYSHLTSLREGL